MGLSIFHVIFIDIPHIQFVMDMNNIMIANGGKRGLLSAMCPRKPPGGHTTPMPLTAPNWRLGCGL